MAYTPHEWESGEVLTPAKLNTLTTAIGEMDMSYTPKTWHDGDILSAAEMNRIENAVASGGGGGGGDFSTATLTVSSAYTVDLYVPQLLEADTWGEGQPPFIYTYENSRGGTYEVLLYKGAAYVGINCEYHSVNCSGDITDMGDNYFLITGDCTITIS